MIKPAFLAARCRRPAATMLLAAVASAAPAAEVLKANNDRPLAEGSSWKFGAAPGPTGVAAWNNTVTGPTAADLGGDLDWQGLWVADPAGDVTLSGSGTLRLGSIGLNTGSRVPVTYRATGQLDLDGPLLGATALTIDSATPHDWTGMPRVTFTGRLALRGAAAAAGSFAGNGIAFGSATVTQAGGFQLDTGAALDDRGELIVTDGWGDGTARPKLTLTSLTGFGDIRSDQGANGIRTLRVDQDHDTLFQGRIISSGYDLRAINLEKAGSGRLTLNRGSSINQTIVTAGTLTVADGGNLGGGRPLAVSAGATFEWARDGSFSGPISGGGRIVRSTTAGNSLFSGNNAGFSGGWLVTAGRVGLVSDASLGAATVGMTLDGGGIYLLATGGTLAASRTITLGPDGGILDGFAGSSQIFAARFIGSGALRKAGEFHVTLTAANDYAGGTTVARGTLVAAAPRALGAGPLAVETGGRLELAAGTALEVGGLRVDDGLLDLGTGRIRIGPGGVSAAALRADLIAGRSGGGWNGSTGITSSAAAASGGRLAVGYLARPDGSAEVAAAAPGDVDLGGGVDVFDLVAVAAAGRYGTGLAAGWAEGDFNYDGVTNVFDLLGISLGPTAGLGTQASVAAGSLGRADQSAALAVVPEPARLMPWLAAAAIGSLFLRRQSLPTISA